MIIAVAIIFAAGEALATMSALTHPVGIASMLLIGFGCASLAAATE